MIERIIIALALIAFSVGAYTLGTHWQVSRVGRKAGASVLNKLRPGIPAVVYFWSETCPPCKAVQSPALKQLETELGPQGVQVIAINAMEEPGVASSWGVLGLPTTFLVDRAGQPRRVNHGVIRAEQLREQIAALN